MEVFILAHGDECKTSALIALTEDRKRKYGDFMLAFNNKLFPIEKFQQRKFSG